MGQMGCSSISPNDINNEQVRSTSSDQPRARDRKLELGLDVGKERRLSI